MSRLPFRMSSYLVEATATTFSLAVGVGVGVIHHMLFQWPRQRSFFFTVGGAVCENFASLAFIYANASRSASETIHLLLLFFGSQVTDSKPFLKYKILTASSLKLIYNTYFRHRGIPSKLMWAATDLTYWDIYRRGQSHKHIEHLHRTMGRNRRYLSYHM